jgi:hypothetical protein
MNDQQHPMREQRTPEHLTTEDIAATPQRPANEQPPHVPTEAEQKEATSEPRPMSERKKAAKAAAEATPLFASDQTKQFRSRWAVLQIEFVNNPRQSAEQADQLVAEVMEYLAKAFANERAKLEQQWEQGNVPTEELRVALQHYRSFFDRLLSF